MDWKYAYSLGRRDRAKKKVLIHLEKIIIGVEFL